MFRPVLVTPPAELPVTVAECKANAVVEHSESDDVIADLLDAAVSRLDGFRGILGRAIITQTWQVACDGWERSFVLPVPDVSSVSVVYDDEDGDEQSGPVMTLHPVAEGTRLRLSDDYDRPTLYTGDGPVRVSFTCGFGGASDVPGNIRVAIMQMVAAMYENREGDVTRMPFFDRLIAPYRWVSF